MKLGGIIVIVCTLCAGTALAQTEVKLNASDPMEDAFLGWAVSIDGDTAVTGAYASSPGPATAILAFR